MLHSCITKKITLLISAFCLSAQIAFAAMPGTPAALNQASAWLRPDGNTVLMTDARRKAVNAQMERSVFGDDFKNLPDTVTSSALTQYVNQFAMDVNQYVQGVPLSHAQAEQLVSDAKANIRPNNAVRYGVVVKRSDLRSFPTLLRAFDTPGDHSFDNWQETAVDPATPVRVYHTNPKGNFIFVRTPHYRGWIPTNQVAITDKKSWLTFVEPTSPAVVTGRLLTLNAGSVPQLYQMGTAIPTANGNLQLPTRNHQGYLEIVPVKAVYGAYLHQGYLPYTTNNTIIMAFKHLGAPYGWGGMQNSVDCSAFVQDVFKTMDVQLPRNGDEQVKAISGKSFQGLSHAQRMEIIKNLPAGSLLFTPFHVMLTLGNANGTPYMIHSLASYGEKSSSGVVRNRIMQVVVSKVDLLGGSGTPLVDQMIQANTIR